MSGEAAHDATRGSPNQDGKVCLAPDDCVRHGRIALYVGGAVAVAFGLVVGCELFFPDLSDKLFPGLFYSHCPSREDYSRAKIAIIEMAVTDYKKRHGDYPPSLEELTAP